MWPWSRKGKIRTDDELREARHRFEINRAGAVGAVDRLDQAVAAEQAEIRKNHLGQLLHTALTTPGRHHA